MVKRPVNPIFIIQLFLIQNKLITTFLILQMSDDNFCGVLFEGGVLLDRQLLEILEAIVFNKALSLEGIHSELGGHNAIVNVISVVGEDGNRYLVELYQVVLVQLGINLTNPLILRLLSKYPMLRGIEGIK